MIRTLPAGDHPWRVKRPSCGTKIISACRIVEGEVPGLGAKWKRGYGCWVREILVWTKAPFLFRNELVAADALAGYERPSPAR